jgi:hypothetical protein
MRRILVSSIVSAVLALPSPLAWSGVGSDKGRLSVRRDGKLIGQENYEIIATATEVQARGELELEMEDMTIRQSSTLLLSADLSPRTYEWKMVQPESTWRRMAFSGNQGTVQYPLTKDKVDQQVFDFGTARVAILGLYHHFLLLAQLYDFSRAGPQTFRVFLPHPIRPGDATVVLEGVEEESVGGVRQPVRRLAITTEDGQVLLWVSESGQFVRLRAPLINEEVIREEPAAGAAGMNHPG